jgi:hypothetical protein
VAPSPSEATPANLAASVMHMVHQSARTFIGTFLPSIEISSSSGLYFLKSQTCVPFTRVYIRITGLVGLLSWLLLPFAPLAYVALLLTVVMLAFELLHMNIRIFLQLAKTFQFWLLLCNVIVWLICGYVSIPKLDNHVWENSQALLIAEYLMLLLWYLLMLGLDSNIVISTRFRLIINTIGFIIVLYPAVCEYTSSPVFVDAATVCFVYCSDTRRLALSSGSSCAFLSLKNIVSLWRHPDMLLMIRIPVVIEYHSSDDTSSTVSSAELLQP